jgi:hypothetical protein
MRASFLVFILALVAGLVGCGSSTDCDASLCGPCQPPVELTVRLTDPALGDVTASGVPGVTCRLAFAGWFSCSVLSVAPGTYTLTLSAPGHVPQTFTFTRASTVDVCCGCGSSFSRDITLALASDFDGGPGDAGPHDGGPSDDAGACDPSAIVIAGGGSLAVGQLCDDVFACVADEAAALAVTAASARFVCSATPEGGCAGWTCAYRAPGGPSVLDADELAEICKVTVLAPQPAMACMIYL